MPDRLTVMRRAGEAFAEENFPVDADDQHFFVIRPVEDSDPPALRQIARGAPEKIMLQFGRAWMFEAEHLAALRVAPGHNVLDGAIFSRRIHCLKDQQDRIAVGGIKELLLRAKVRNMFIQQFFIMLLRLIYGTDL